MKLSYTSIVVRLIHQIILIANCLSELNLSNARLPGMEILQSKMSSSLCLFALKSQRVMLKTGVPFIHL